VTCAGLICGLEPSLAQCTFREVINLLSANAHRMWETCLSGQALYENSPAQYKKMYGRDISGIIDATEIFIERPTCKNAARACWSRYKHRYTVKVCLQPHPSLPTIVPQVPDSLNLQQQVLFVLSPFGMVKYTSDAYPGRITGQSPRTSLALLPATTDSRALTSSKYLTSWSADRDLLKVCGFMDIGSRRGGGVHERQRSQRF
jgi:hypothetical protein